MTILAPPVADRPPRLVAAVWMLLIVNNLGTSGGIESIIPLPRSAFQAITMGSLLLAFLLALLLNPKFRVVPSPFLLMLTMLALVSLVSSLRLESGAGSLFRCFRLLLMIVTMWLVSRWWRGDLSFVRLHLRGLCAILLSVLIGLAIAPGPAFSGPDGRLVGAIWPIPPPQVALYCAIAIGFSLLLWITSHIDARSAVTIIVPAVALLLLTHTRTALLGLSVGLLVAGVSLVGTSARARRVLSWTIVLAVPVTVFLGGFIQTWLERGQDPELLANLTGRAKVWEPLLALHRTLPTEILGVGLTDKSFNGLPIDNSWLTIYNEQGWGGIVLVVLMLGVLLGGAAFRPPSPARACALFLVTYAGVASYTEVGLGDSSPYLMCLAVAASLLVSPAAGRAPDVVAGPASVAVPSIRGREA